MRSAKLTRLTWRLMLRKAAVASDVTYRIIAEAIERADLSDVRRLFTEHPELLRDEDGLDTWLWQAAHRGDLALVQLLVDLGIGVDESNDKELPRTAVDSAAAEGHLTIVQWLLDRGATINHRSQSGVRCPALSSAAWNGHLEIVKLLVERGADFHSSISDMNALMLAKVYGQQEVVDYLRSVGAKDLRETNPADHVASHRLIVEHMAGLFGTVSDWNVEIPGDPEVVIHYIPATTQCNEQTLFTVGLSDRRLPTEWEEFACGELTLTLSPDWHMTISALSDPRWNWPLEWLKRIVVELRQRDRWPFAPVLFSDEPAVPFHRETKLCCWLCVPVQGGSIQIPDCRWIDFHGLIPIYAEEMQLVRERGHEPLINRMHARNLPTYLDPARPNVAGDPEPST